MVFSRYSYFHTLLQLITDDPRVKGCGLTFTLGRGNELVLHAVDSLRFLVVGRHIEAIQSNRIFSYSNQGHLVFCACSNNSSSSFAIPILVCFLRWHVQMGERANKWRSDEMGWSRKGGKCDSIESPKHFASYCFSSTQGVLALAVGGIVNSFWDLWGKLEGKPVWKLLCDMTPEQIVTLVDFR